MWLMYFLTFHKSLPRASAFVNWISVRFYETGCIICSLWKSPKLLDIDFFQGLKIYHSIYQFISMFRHIVNLLETFDEKVDEK